MKMKRLAISATALLLALSLFACAKGGDGSDTTAKEPSKDGIEYTYSGGTDGTVTASKTYKDGVVISESKYDYWPNGKLMSIETTKDGALLEKWYYNYHENGLLSQMVRKATEEGFALRDDYRYNEKGLIVSITYYTDDKSGGSVAYTYNEKDELAREDTIDTNGDVIAYTEYTFDESLKATGLKSYMYGSLISYSEYEYNEKGLLSKVSSYLSDGTLTGIVENEYNADGKVTKVKNMSADGVLTGYTECLYDDSGFNYRDIYYEDGTPVYRYDYTKEGARVYSPYN